MPTLARGQKQKLSDLTPALQLRAEMRATATGLTFDFSCFGVDGANQLSDDRFFVFYNQKASPNGEISLTGDGDFSLDLSRLPGSIQKLVFVLTIDGNGTLAQLQKGQFNLLANNSSVATFEFQGSDFSREKAIIVAEIYLKDVWRLAAVGQGFAGGLDALLAHFGGQQAEEAAPAIAPTPPAASAPPVNLKKIELEKKMERQAPQLVSLAKKAQVSLEKVGLSQHTARVALCLDISASMMGLYRSGKIQRFAEKVLALGTRFDDDGAIDVFLFGANAHDAGPMGIENFQDFVPQLQRRFPLEGGTVYDRAMQLIRQHYFPDGLGRARTSPRADKAPVYVMFLTDGQTSDANATRQQVQWSSYEPIFWQFMGLGKSRKDVKKGGGGFWASAFASDFTFLEELDNMPGRYCDNANFFSVSDPDVLADDELYDLMMAEYPAWVKQAPAKGLIR
jgi:stress response protein SCP2